LSRNVQFIYRRNVIMQQAHVWLREHENRIAANGGVWFGTPKTLPDFIEQASRAAKQEAHYALRGYNLDTLFYVTAVEDASDMEDAA
jgi:hypothetical protein